MEAFFEAFWPNLAATLIGIVLGVPIALGLNERVLERQRKIQAADDRRKLKHVVDVLIDACRYNMRVLDTMGDMAENGHVMHSPDLRITTWDAVGPTLSAGSSSPELLQMLSHHWLRLRRIQTLSDEMFAREVAKSLPPIEDQKVVLEFWRVLHGNARNLSAHAGQAIGTLEALKTDLETEHAV
jgi:hypothetical protein